jgi:hypothetical protein
MPSFLYKFSTAYGTLGRKFVLKVLQAICAHEAEVDVAFGAVTEAAADAFAAGVTRS